MALRFVHLSSLLISLHKFPLQKYKMPDRNVIRPQHSILVLFVWPAKTKRFLNIEYAIVLLYASHAYSFAHYPNSNVLSSAHICRLLTHSIQCCICINVYICAYINFPFVVMFAMAGSDLDTIERLSIRIGDLCTSNSCECERIIIYISHEISPSSL